MPLFREQVFKYFRLLDQFGYDIRLQAEGQQTFKTTIGAFMTILLFSLIAYSSGSFIIEMNQGSNASLNLKEAVLLENEGFIFQPNEFAFAVGVVDAVGQVIPNVNNEIFTITFYYCQKFWNETNCVFIPSVPCGKLLREINYDYQVTKEYENVTHCMNADYLKSIPNIPLNGYQGMNTFTDIGALVQSCQNDTVSQNCASQDVINNYLKNSNVFYTYTTFSFNKELDGYPYEKQQNTDVSVLFQNTIKYIKVFQKYSLTLLEYNPFYFFPKFTYQEALEYDETIFDMALNIQNNNLIADVSIRLSAKKQLYYVCYQTLMDVAAKIGGFYTILRLLIQIFLFPIQFIMYKLYLINCLISQQLTMSDQVELLNRTSKLTLINLIKHSQARSIFRTESILIDKLLDITQILFNPLKISRQVENLQGSLRKIDFSKKNLNNLNLDEFIGDLVQSKEVESARSINQEFRANQVLNIQHKHPGHRSRNDG